MQFLPYIGLACRLPARRSYWRHWHRFWKAHDRRYLSSLKVPSYRILVTCVLSGALVLPLLYEPVTFTPHTMPVPRTWQLMSTKLIMQRSFLAREAGISLAEERQQNAQAALFVVSEISLLVFSSLLCSCFFVMADMEVFANAV